MDLNGFFFITGGFILLLFLVIRIKKTKAILKNYREVDAYVVTHEIQSGTNGSRLYYPVLKFQIHDGTWITAKYHDGFYPQKFLDNQKVKLQYSIEDYKRFTIRDIDKQFNLILILASVVMILFGVYYLIK